MSESDDHRDLARAKERADLARLRFGNAVDDLLDRLSPDRLRGEVIDLAAEHLDLARRDIMQRFRHWPVALATVSAAGLAVIFWRPARVAARYGLRVASFVWTTRHMWRLKE